MTNKSEFYLGASAPQASTFWQFAVPYMHKREKRISGSSQSVIQVQFAL